MIFFKANMSISNTNFQQDITISKYFLRIQEKWLKMLVHTSELPCYCHDCLKVSFNSYCYLTRKCIFHLHTHTQTCIICLHTHTLYKVTARMSHIPSTHHVIYCFCVSEISWTASSVKKKYYQLFCTVLWYCCCFVDFYMLIKHFQIRAKFLVHIIWCTCTRVTANITTR